MQSKTENPETLTMTSLGIPDGRSKKDWAAAIGVHHATFSRWIHGRRKPSKRFIEPLARELQMDTEELQDRISGLFPRQRVQLSRTQSSLAKQLNVPQSTVARWLTGVNIPRGDSLRQLAEALGRNEDELLIELHRKHRERRGKHL